MLSHRPPQRRRVLWEGRRGKRRGKNVKEERESGGLKKKKTHDEVVLGVVGLAPGGHDKGVVGGNHDDLLNALCLEGIDVLDEAGQVVGLACGCEGAGDGDDDNLLVFEFCIRIEEKIISMASEQKLSVGKLGENRGVPYRCWHQT